PYSQRNSRGAMHTTPQQRYHRNEQCDAGTSRFRDDRCDGGGIIGDSHRAAKSAIDGITRGTQDPRKQRRAGIAEEKPTTTVSRGGESFIQPRSFTAVRIKVVPQNHALARDSARMDGVNYVAERPARAIAARPPSLIAIRVGVAVAYADKLPGKLRAV